MSDALLDAVQPAASTSSTWAGRSASACRSRPNHPQFWHTLPRRHGDMVRPDGGIAANDMITMGTHVGTHIDALAHVSHDGKLHGGADARGGPGRQVPGARRAHDRADGPPRRAPRRRRPPRRGRLRGRLRDHRRRPRGDRAAARRRARRGRRGAHPQRLGTAIRRGAARTSARTPACPASARPAPGGSPSSARTPSAPTRSRSNASPPEPGTRCCRPTACCSSSTASTSSRRWTSSGSPAPAGPRVHVRAGAAQHRRRHRLAGAAAGDEAGMTARQTLAEQLGEFAADTQLRRPARRGRRQRRMRVLDTPRHRASRRHRWPRAAPPAAGRTRQGGAPAPRPSASPLRLRPPWPPSSTASSPTRSTTTTPTCPPCCTRARRWCRRPWPRPSARRRRPRRRSRAIAVGLEVCVRLGMAGYDEDAGNSIFFEHGQHATSICGAMGGAVAAAAARHPWRLADSRTRHPRPRCRRLDGVRDHRGQPHRRHRQADALRLGRPRRASSAADLVRARLHRAAHRARGQVRLLPGLAARHLQPGRRHRRARAAGGRCPRIFFKPYPANHFTHAASTRLRPCARAASAPTDVESITVGVPAANLRTDRRADRRQARADDRLHGAVLGPYAVAVGLLGGGGLGASASRTSPTPRRRTRLGAT